ncbi:glycosyltransferase [Ruminococcus flavefaciens]|uniref:glycosyltransferase n=1 Tax=Ruminococcus flavefaciens TaxID=1265 RepID=UPI0026F2C37C|nr:glycosyltransferase [Ruminococcus flavefaciens]
MDFEKYSVLMSVYKNEDPRYLTIALNSMIKQTIQPDEIVLVEDGPLTDGLYLVIGKFVKKYPNLFKIVVNEMNLGLGLALRKGLCACSNELVARMDTDDVAGKIRCEKQLAFFKENPDVDIVGGQIEEFIGDISNVVGKRIVPLNDTELKEYSKVRCPFNHMTVMFKKSVVIDAGNYMDLHYDEDYYLWIRMMELGAKFANLESVLVKVRVSEDMYNRRGGLSYFKSEFWLEKYKLNHGIIDIVKFASNSIKRLIVQVMIPNSIRGWVFRTFARE